MRPHEESEASIAPWVALGAGAWFILGAGSTVTDRDAGELSTAAFHLDVAHPTGFPLDMALFRLGALLPAGDVAFRMDLVVALWSALACALVAALTERLAGGVAAPWRRLLALLAPVALACSATVLRASTAAEVYASALGVSLVALAARELGDASDAQRTRLTGLIAGVTLALHTSARPAAALVLVSLVARRWTGRPWTSRVRTLGVSAALGAAMLPLLAYIPLASLRNGPIDWNDPETLGALWRHLSAGSIRAAYAHRMLVAWRVPEDLTRALRMLHDDLGAVVLASALGGCLLAARSALARLVALVGLIDLVYAVAVNPMGMSDRQTLFHAEACLALVAALPWARALSAERRGVRLGAGGMLVATLAFSAWRCDTTWTARADGWSSSELLGGAGALGEVPPRALVLCGSDDFCGVALYAQKVEGERPDVTVLPRQHVAYAWTWRRLEARRFGRTIALTPSRTGGAAETAARLGDVLAQASDRVRWEGDDTSDPSLWRTFQRPGSGETPVLGVIGAPVTSVDTEVARWVRERLPSPPGAGARRVGAGVIFSAASRVARGDFSRAVALWEECARVNPEHVSAYTNLGVAASRRGDLPGAITLTRHALTIDPERPVAWRNLRDYLAAVGDRDGAREADEEQRRRR